MEQRSVPVPPLQGTAASHWKWGPLFPAVLLVWVQTSLQAQIMVGRSLHQLFTWVFTFWIMFEPSRDVTVTVNPCAVR